jgi:MerR family transcriptional regulator, thiopeptide resistance regulator
MHTVGMTDSLPINEVVRRTGLTSRTLRFYESRGLVTPLRTASGRRIFGARELSRLHQIAVLKLAGLSLSQMQRLFAGHAVDLSAMLAAQLKMLDEEAAQVKRARQVIRFAMSRLEEGERIDTATFCSLIEAGQRMSNQEPKAWQAIIDRYFSPEEKAKWATAWQLIDADFDAQSYDAQWKRLGDRIKTALPMEPESETAQAFVDEWFELLKPFSAVSTPDMWQSSMKMYDEMDQWTGDGAPDPGFDKSVWDFMKRATTTRIMRGGTLPGFEAGKKGD